MSYKKNLISITLITLMSLIVSLSWFGCGGLLGGDTSITVSPSVPNVAKDTTHQFSAVNQDGKDITSLVTWSVASPTANISVPEFAESVDVGSINSTGLYTAPASLPTNNSVTVSAQSGDVTGTATINLTVGEDVTFVDEPVVETTSDTGIFSTPKMVAFGSIYVVTFDLNFSPAVTGKYLLSKSVDGGSTFVDTEFTMDTLSIKPKLDSDASGNLYIAYSGTTDGSHWWTLVKKTTDEGASFTELTVPQTTDATDQPDKDFAVDSAGNIYLALVARREEATKFIKLYFMTLNAGETSFTNLGELAGIEGEDFDKILGWPNVVTASDGSVYILYDITRDTFSVDPNRDVWIRKYSSGVIGDAVRVSPNEDAGPFNSKMVIDSQGVFHVIWAYKSDASQVDTSVPVTIKYTTSSDGGNTFSTPVEIAAPGGDYWIAYQPAIGVDLNDNLTVAYYSWDGSALDIYSIRSTDGGVNWEAPVKMNDQSGVTEQGGALIRPDVGVATDSAGRVYVTGSLNYTGGSGPWQLMLAIGK